MNEESILANWRRYEQTCKDESRLCIKGVRGETWNHIQKHQVDMYQERQKMVMELLSQGLNVTDVSRRMKISRPAVERHIRNHKSRREAVNA